MRRDKLNALRQTHITGEGTFRVAPPAAAPIAPMKGATGCHARALASHRGHFRVVGGSHVIDNQRRPPPIHIQGFIQFIINGNSNRGVLSPETIRDTYRIVFLHKITSLILLPDGVIRVQHRIIIRRTCAQAEKQSRKDKKIKQIPHGTSYLFLQS